MIKKQKRCIKRIIHLVTNDSLYDWKAFSKRKNCFYLLFTNDGEGIDYNSREIGIFVFGRFVIASLQVHIQINTSFLVSFNIVYHLLKCNPTQFREILKKSLCLPQPFSGNQLVLLFFLTSQSWLEFPLFLLYQYTWISSLFSIVLQCF